MCYLCLKSNPFDVIDKITNKFPDIQKNKVRAQILKALITRIEDANKGLCNSGNDTYIKLKEEQYKLSQKL